MRFIKHLIAAVAAMPFLSSGHAQAQTPDPIDPADLAARIEDGTRAIWPDMKVETTIEGCQYHEVKHYRTGGGPTRAERRVDLRDVDFDPSSLWQEGQNMADGETGQTWVSYGIAYKWKDGTLSQNQAHFMALIEEVEAIWKEPESSFWSFLFPPDFVPVYIERGKEIRALFDRVQAGEFGAFTQRNYDTYQEYWGDDVVFDFAAIDPQDDDYSFLHWVLRDDVADGITADMASYAATHCSGPAS